MRINTNITALNTFNNYTKNNDKISSSVAKLSSGYAINSAADNAAGLATSEKMRAQIRGLNKASSNSQDAISLVQTAEGALSSSDEILQRMRELAVQSSSDTNDDSIDRSALQDEFSQLQKELNEVSSTTTFNGKNLLDGSLAQKTAKVATTDLANSGMTVELGNAAAGSYTFNISTQFEAAAVADKAPTSYEVVKGNSGSYFSTASASAESNVAASDLLNGDYDLTATYSTANKNITVTAKGNNGQSFTATVSSADLAGLSGATSLTLNFNKDAGDAFQVDLNLASTISQSDSNYTTLASNLSALSVSVAGGVTAQEAKYGVYANMTGADSVKLEAGMSSVSFSNGVKVNFNELTTSSVDTTNKAEVAADIDGTGVTAGAAASGYTISYSNFSATDNSTITDSTASSDFAIAKVDANTIKATIGGKDYTATISDEQLASLNFAATDTVANSSSKTVGLTFNDPDGQAAFTLDVNATVVDATGGSTANTATTTDADALVASASADGLVSNAGHNYAKTFSASAVDLSASTASTFTVENSKGAGLTIQVGANEGDEMVINIDKMDSNYLGVSSSSVSTQSAASAAIKSVNSAINQVSSQRAYLGAIQNRLDYKIDNLNTASENMTSAESQIRDVDMAKEMTTFTNANILQQAATAMLAQANSLPQNVLSLIGK